MEGGGGGEGRIKSGEERKRKVEKGEWRGISTFLSSVYMYM